MKKIELFVGLATLVGAIGFVSASARTAQAGVDGKLELASLGDLAKCESRRNRASCYEAVKSYVAKHPSESFEAGKAVTVFYNHWMALPFFEQALKKKATAVQCSDKRVLQAVNSALALPNEHPQVAVATQIAATWCWPQLKEGVLKELNSSFVSSYQTHNTCPILVAKNESLPAACQPKAAKKKKPARAQFAQIDPKTAQVAGPARVYRGSENRKVTLVRLRRKNYFLVKFEGFRGPWNGRVVVHQEEASASGYNYWSYFGKKRHITVTSRSKWGNDASYDVYPTGDAKSYRVSYDDKASKLADPKSLLQEFAQ